MLGQFENCVYDARPECNQHMVDTKLYDLGTETLLENYNQFYKKSPAYVSPYNAEICLYKPSRSMGFLQFEIIINVLLSSSRFIWIPMLLVYGRYKYLNYFSVGNDFIRQNLTSTDVRFWRIKSFPALKGLNYIILFYKLSDNCQRIGSGSETCQGSNSRNWGKKLFVCDYSPFCGRQVWDWRNCAGLWAVWGAPSHVSQITRRLLAAHRSYVADFYDNSCNNNLNSYVLSGSDMRLVWDWLVRRSAVRVQLQTD